MFQDDQGHLRLREEGPMGTYTVAVFAPGAWISCIREENTKGGEHEV